MTSDKAKTKATHAVGFFMVLLLHWVGSGIRNTKPSANGGKLRDDWTSAANLVAWEWTVRRGVREA